MTGWLGWVSHPRGMKKPVFFSTWEEEEGDETGGDPMGFVVVLGHDAKVKVATAKVNVMAFTLSMVGVRSRVLMMMELEVDDGEDLHVCLRG